MTEADILNLIRENEWMMGVLRTAEDLNLPGWAIGAGFVRNKVWDCLHGIEREGVDTPDVDLIYFDPNGNNEQGDEELSDKLKKETGINWEVVNQAYTHEWNNVPAHISTEDAISTFPETVTAIGVRLKNDNLQLIASYGIDDLINLKIRLVPKSGRNMEYIKERVRKKQWLEKWPKLKIVT